MALDKAPLLISNFCPCQTNHLIPVTYTYSLRLRLKATDTMGGNLGRIRENKVCLDSRTGRKVQQKTRSKVY